MKKPVPGGRLSQYGAFALAEAYRLAGDAVGRDSTSAGGSNNPRHLLYLIALENYLRADLLFGGLTPAEVRSFQHDLAGMLHRCAERGLQVDDAVSQFIEAATRDNDYVRVRYDVDLQYLGGDEPPPHRPNAEMVQLVAAVTAVRAAIGRRVVPLAKLD